jgi:hypothetical protein
MRVCELLNELKDCQQDAQLIIAVPDVHAGHVLELESVAKEEKEPVIILIAHSTTKKLSPTEAVC